MTPNGSLLSEKFPGRLCRPIPSLDFLGSVEQAIFHARAALEAGWQLTPKEIVLLVGPGAWRDDRTSSGVHESGPETEDEIDEIPRFFGER
ncbi:MAG TPA: hypothetical protein VMC06_04470 [Opitutaceae bacterium]|nr:hypothetical protein [Opitutaceae bacterium]